MIDNMMQKKYTRQIGKSNMQFGGKTIILAFKNLIK